MRKTMNAKYFVSSAVLAVALGATAGCAGNGGGSWGNETSGEMLAEDMVAVAIDDAQAAVDYAKARNWIWKSTEKILKQAKAAANEGEDEKAMKLAAKAERQAEKAENQYYLEHAKLMLKEWEDYGTLSNKPQDKVKSLQEAIRMGEGAKAYNIAKKMS